MEALLHQKKKLVLTLVKQKQNLHCNGDNSYLFVNRKKNLKFKADNGNINFPTQLCVGIISNEFNYVDAELISFKGNVYGFSIDYNAIDKFDILDIQKYLIVKNNIK